MNQAEPQAASGTRPAEAQALHLEAMEELRASEESLRRAEAGQQNGPSVSVQVWAPCVCRHERISTFKSSCVSIRKYQDCHTCLPVATRTRTATRAA